MKRFSLSAALTALALILPAAAWANAENGNRAAPQQQQGQALETRPGDGELSTFVAAFVRLIGVQHGYMVLMQDEQDPSRLEEMKRDAVTDMTAAVERDGLSVDRYNQIALAVRDDPDLQGRVEAILQQMASDPSAPPAPEGE